MVQETARRVMDAKEFADRRYAMKAINAMVNYGRSKLSGYPFHAQIEHDGKIWKISITVEYVRQEPPIQIIPNKEIDGALI